MRPFTLTFHRNESETSGSWHSPFNTEEPGSRAELCTQFLEALSRAEFSRSQKFNKRGRRTSIGDKSSHGATAIGKRKLNKTAQMVRPINREIGVETRLRHSQRVPPGFRLHCCALQCDFRPACSSNRACLFNVTSPCPSLSPSFSLIPANVVYSFPSILYYLTMRISIFDVDPLLKIFSSLPEWSYIFICSYFRLLSSRIFPSSSPFFFPWSLFDTPLD